MVDLKVIARASSQDRALIVAGLQQMQKKVAVVCKSVNDLQALKLADVGVSLTSS